jgi:putative oxidoreductase
MKNCLLQTDASLAATIARLTLALVFIPHGLQMTLGLFGGYGFSGTMGFFTTQLGIPTVVAFLVIMAESVGAFALALGFMTRFSALSLIIVMLGAIFMSHLPNGFFMNWFGNQPGEGYEYHLLVIGLCLSLVVSGGGCCSVDRMLAGGKMGCCSK